ncbi:hypothetical protein LOC67_04315 [Stieleria sp. JC731]|uniref:hypothetical protein n=1 Tax=Pirellulaceae TaxID=2691357 RepID=UPI001E4D1A95|nr:hypothetical protein [Stieleria sp. JC731]MCC9599776.1 hypothetical protein [Stieleria sp. JC731]
MRHDFLRRLPIFSLLTAAVAAAVLLTGAILDLDIPAVGQGALGFVILASSIADAIRLARGGAGQGGADESSGMLTAYTNENLKQWIEEQSTLLQQRSSQLTDRALALQQWMQFPEAINFRTDGDPSQINQSQKTIADQPETASLDPLESCDKALLTLIDAKTKELFNSIKHDAYRKKTEQGYEFKTEKIREDLFRLVSDVAAIYRPDDPAPLLRTNVEAISRAAGRASLRLLVAVESLPVSLATYDFQSIYKLVTQAVRTFGFYKSAKPYLDVASTMWAAGRIVISANPITMAAWWAASKATTYGASKLGQHVLDQQAVGLIRQLVEIVAIEVASIYSPMVRYRDIHWVYGVELVHLASRLKLSDAARLEAMRQLAVINLKDEYGRVSLMRQLAGGRSSHPDQYSPAQSLSLADRTIVAERLEEFLLTHVLSGSKINRGNAELIEQWQNDAGERLEIQFRAGKVHADETEQLQRAVWAIAAFLLEHLGDEPDDLEASLLTTKSWGEVHSDTQQKYLQRLCDDPPYLYHPPEIAPEGNLAKLFLSDLASIAASPRNRSAPTDAASFEKGQVIELPKQTRESTLRVTAYFLRSDPDAIVEHYRKAKAANLGNKNLPHIIIDSAAWLSELAGQKKPRALYGQARLRSPDEPVTDADSTVVIRLNDDVICYAVDETVSTIQIRILGLGRWKDTKFIKQGGYIRSDCEIQLPGSISVTIPGPTFSSYEEWFKPLTDA